MPFPFLPTWQADNVTQITPDFLKAQGCEASVTDVMDYLKSMDSQELSDDDLDMVAGGNGSGCTTASCSGKETCGCPAKY